MPSNIYGENKVILKSVDGVKPKLPFPLYCQQDLEDQVHQLRHQCHSCQEGRSLLFHHWFPTGDINSEMSGLYWVYVGIIYMHFTLSPCSPLSPLGAGGPSGPVGPCKPGSPDCPGGPGSP